MDNNKITNAMHRIEDLYNETNGQCYLSFSGGKDSTVILALIKMCEDIYTIPKDGIKAVYCDTRIELNAIRDFVFWCKENWYQNIEVIRPEASFSYVLKTYGKPMKSKLKSELLSRWQKYKSENAFNQLLGKEGKKYVKAKIGNKDLHLLNEKFDIRVSNKCCEILKKKPFKKYNIDNNMKGYMLGFRIEEGGVRELNALKRVSTGGKICTSTKDGLIIKMPIIDWSDKDIDDFINEYNIPLSKAYTEYGMNRTGCIGCPFSRQLEEDLKILYKYEPLRYKAAIYWLEDVYIAQNVVLPFDEQYEEKRKEKWEKDYRPMRYEMLKKYFPDTRLFRRDDYFYKTGKEIRLNTKKKKERQ